MLKHKIVIAIRVSGWVGLLLNVIAICFHSTEGFLVAQIVSCFSAFLWSYYIQHRLTWDLLIGLVLTVAAAIVKDPFIMYTAMITRSFSYQLQFERLVRQRREID
jgi:hypothetical protein